MPDAAARARRVARPWRVAFIVVGLAVTVGTHWPQLVLSEDVPASDKTIHAIAFATLTLLLWQTGWMRRRSWLGIVMIAWAMLDEFSQGLPILGRHMTWQDGLANVLGVSIVVSWTWALGAVGGRANRLRLAFQRHVTEEQFSSMRTWVLLLLAFLACAAPLVLLWPWLRPTGTTVPTGIAAIVWISVTAMLLVNLRRAALRRQAGRRPCLACGASCRRVEYDARGDGRCSACRRAVHRGTWSQPGPPPTALQVQLGGGLMATGLAIVMIAIAAIVIVVPWAYATLLGAGIGRSALPRLAREIGQMPPSLIRVIDLSLLLGLFAVLTRLYRRRLARHYDRPWTCVGCGHDLRGTPVSQGVGRCGECGRRFVRMQSPDDVHHGVTESTENGKN